MWGGCKSDPVDIAGDIAGTVTDAATNEPLGGVTMTLQPSGKTTSTSASGQYEFSMIDAGSGYTVQARKNGYQTDQQSITVEVGKSVPLNFSLQPSMPVLNLSQEQIDFGAESSTYTLDIANTGFAALSWQITEDISWLQCLPAAGTTQQGQTASVVLTVDRTGLSRGSYAETLAVTSNGGSRVVRVTMNVQGLTLSLQPEELDFGFTASSMTLTMTNTSQQPVSYTLTPSNEWILPSKTQGTCTYSESLTVAVDRTDRSEGDYEGTLTLTASDQSINIPVRMNIPSKARPTVSLLSIDNITYSSAVLRGSVVSIGSGRVTRHGFCWSTTEEPALNVANVQSCNLGDQQTAHDFSYTTANMEPSTAYYVRAYAENAEGISYSNQMKLITKGTPQKPTVETGAISAITDVQAQVSGNILNVGDEGGITQYGHAWSQRENPTVSDNTTQLGSTQQSGTFTSALTGLQPNQTYHVRAYAINNIGVAYGEDQTFTTTTGQVVVQTGSVTSITHNAATATGIIVQTGGNTITERGLCWATTASPTLSASHAASAVTETDTFTARMTGLQQETSYHARAYVKTQKGEVFYGNDVAFSTTHEIVLPTVGQTATTDIGVSKAVLSSAVQSNGRGTVSDAGFVYSLSSNPTTADQKVSCGAVNGNFGKTVTGLKENTTYHVRAYATNEAGTAYGAEATFTTQEVTVPILSEVSMGTVSNTTAQCSAAVTSTGNGTLADAGFVYATDHYPTTANGRVSCGKSTTLSATASGLTPETTYYVRAYAINEKGTSYGAERQFTTARQEVSPYTTLTVETSYGSTTLDMATVKGGTFKMGAQSLSSAQDNYDASAYSDERPVHQVTLPTFYMSKTLVTQYLWYVVMGSYPSVSTALGLGDGYPVYNVSYAQCQQFISRLSALTGKTFRMPTEAEWEYAARGGQGGSGTPYSGGSTPGTVAWYSGNAGGKTHPVAQKQPNELNIYDMNGNLWEWCSDWYALYSSAAQTSPAGPASGSSRVIRGGGYSDNAADIRITVRSSANPSTAYTTVGLRLVMQ